MLLPDMHLLLLRCVQRAFIGAQCRLRHFELAADCSAEQAAPSADAGPDVTGEKAERHQCWPRDDAGLNSDSQELLRLHRVSPLPSALPHPEAILVPDLQPGFTAAQALQRVTVRAPVW